MEKKQIQEAINRVNQAVAQLEVIRAVHIALTNDIQLIQQCCENYFNHVIGKPKEEPKDGGTNIIPIGTATGDEDSEGSGDGI